jgi:hypothetical protein
VDGIFLCLAGRLTIGCGGLAWELISAESCTDGWNDAGAWV